MEHTEWAALPREVRELDLERDTLAIRSRYGDDGALDVAVQRACLEEGGLWQYCLICNTRRVGGYGGITKFLYQGNVSHQVSVQERQESHTPVDCDAARPIAAAAMTETIEQALILLYAKSSGAKRQDELE